MADGGPGCIPWWRDTEVRRAIKKNEAFKVCLYRKDEFSRGWYIQARRTSKLDVKAAKEWVCKDCGLARKKFWQTIRCLRGRDPGVVRGVVSKDGILLSEEELSPTLGTKGDETGTILGIWHRWFAVEDSGRPYGFFIANFSVKKQKSFSMLIPFKCMKFI